MKWSMLQKICFHIIKIIINNKNSVSITPFKQEQFNLIVNHNFNKALILREELKL